MRFKGPSCVIRYLLCVVLLFLVDLAVGSVMGNVVLYLKNNTTISLDELEARFTPPIQSSAECGVLHPANPLDACSPLTNTIVDDSKSSFALIMRGGCSFDEKVKTAQKAGFDAAIIYDNEDNQPLVSMSGSSADINIYAVFISKASGEALNEHTDPFGADVCITPLYKESAWTIAIIIFIILLAVACVIFTCYFVHRHHVSRGTGQLRPHHVPESSHGMSGRLVKAMPSLMFTTVLEDNCTSMTCAICLDDYTFGEKLRILPCCHKFHAFCVDSWLTSWRTFCPVCKRDARTSINIPPASECTPLLSSAHASPSRSSSASASPAIQIGLPYRYPLPSSRSHSVASSTPQEIGQFEYRSNSSSLSNSRHSNGSMLDLGNLPSSSQQSSHSLRYPPQSPVISRMASPNGVGYGSPSVYLVGSSSSRRGSHLVQSFGHGGSPSGYLIRSSSRQSSFLRNSDSVASFAGLSTSSGQSLPES